MGVTSGSNIGGRDMLIGLGGDGGGGGGGGKSAGGGGGSTPSVLLAHESLSLGFSCLASGRSIGGIEAATPGGGGGGGGGGGKSDTGAGGATSGSA